MPFLLSAQHTNEARQRRSLGFGLIVPSHELFNSCQLLLDGAATRDDRAFIVLSAMLAAGGEGTLEEMALQRLAEGDIPVLPLRSVVFLTCAVARWTGRALSGASAKATLAPVVLAQLRSCATQSMQEETAKEEWRQLKESNGESVVPSGYAYAVPRGRAELITALGWLLASAEEMEEARDILLGAVVLESGITEADGSQSEWEWLADCLPSPRWMAQHVEVLLGHALQVEEDVACGVLTLLSTCFTDAKAAAAIVSNHAMAGLAMRWQRSGSGNSPLVKCIGLFMLQQLAAAPGDALQHSPLLAMVMETLQCNPSAALAPELAVVAYFRAWDVPKLRQKQDEKDANTGSGPKLHSALLDRFERSLQDEDSPMDLLQHGVCDNTMAWALGSSSLLLTGCPMWTSLKSKLKPDALQSISSSTAFRLLAVACAYLKCPAMVQKPKQSHEDLQSLLLFLRSLSDLLWALDGEANEWSAAVTDAAALAILGLFSAVQPLAASEMLHSERCCKSLQSAVERLLQRPEQGGMMIEEESASEEKLQRRFSGPILLLLLLLLRSEAGWLKDLEISRIQPTLRTLVQSKGCLGAQRLLLLRLAEELVFQSPGSGSECHQVVLKQLLSEQRWWDLATQEVREMDVGVDDHQVAQPEVLMADDLVISSDEEVDLMSLQKQAKKLRMAEGSRLPGFASSMECFQQLHVAMCRRLVNTLAMWTKERLRLISQQSEQKQELMKARQDLARKT
eukprot:symbB.v1.2.010802.t1/scaffold712.1/size170421/1